MNPWRWAIAPQRGPQQQAHLFSLPTGIKTPRDLPQARPKRSGLTIAKQRDRAAGQNKKVRIRRNGKRIVHRSLCLGVFMQGEITFEQTPEYRKISRVAIAPLLQISNRFVPSSVAAGDRSGGIK